MTTTTASTRAGINGRRVLLITACIALSLHGLIELAALALVFNPNLHAVDFAFRELADNPLPVAVIGIVFGLMRVLAAGGILANRLWGWMLGVILSAATLAMLTLYLPAGATDAIFSALALTALLVARYGSQPIP